MKYNSFIISKVKTVFDEHKIIMREALREAVKSYNSGEVPVGAVIVKDGKILSKAHNEVEKKSNSLLHAELLAIQRAIKKTGNKYLNDCKIYVTLEPCPMCVGAIMLAKLSEIYFGAYDKKYGACGSRINLIQDNLFNHNIKCYGGILEEESSMLLKDFFKVRR